MDYLYQRNRWVAAQEGRPLKPPQPGTEISAKGKKVIVIGGGDTGHGLHLQLPPRGRAQRGHARRLRRAAARRRRSRAIRGRCRPSARSTTYALDEGGKRRWGTEVTGFGGKDGAVSHVYARQVTGTSSRDLTPVPGSEFVLEADLVLIAIGFEHPEHEGLVEELGARPRPPRQHPHPADLPHVDVKGVYACGDARIGQSLIVTAIAEGRKCARIVNKDLGGTPMDEDREKLAIGAWSGEADRTLRHEAEAAGTVRPGRGVLQRAGHTQDADELRCTDVHSLAFSEREWYPFEAAVLVALPCGVGAAPEECFRFTARLGTGKLAPVGQGTAPPLP